MCRCEVLPLGGVGKKGSARLGGALASPCRLRGRRNERRASTGLRCSTTDGRSDRSSPALGIGSYREAARYVRLLPYGRNTDRLQLATGPKGGARRLLHQTRSCSPNSPARTAGVSL